MGRKAVTYNEYVKSDTWKCEDSPSGAHYWVEMVQTIKLAKEGYFQCKYCSDVRRFVVSFHYNPLAKSGEQLKSEEEYYTK